MDTTNPYLLLSGLRSAGERKEGVSWNDSEFATQRNLNGGAVGLPQVDGAAQLTEPVRKPVEVVSTLDPPGNRGALLPPEKIGGAMANEGGLTEELRSIRGELEELMDRVDGLMVRAVRQEPQFAPPGSLLPS